jgi:hypothetical protein
MKMEAQAIFLNPYTICISSKRKLSFVRLLMKKQAEVIHLQNGPLGLAHLCLCDILGLFMAQIWPADFRDLANQSVDNGKNKIYLSWKVSYRQPYV